jgi:parallel beta-helix repeat protein
VVTTSGSDGFYSNNASGFTITDSNMTLNNGSGVYVDGTASTGVTVRDSSFGIGTGENVAAGNKMYGIAFAGGSNHVADNNTIGGNDLTGLLAFSPQAGTTLTNVDLLNNWVGLTRNEEAVPNGTAGIWVLGDVPGQGSVDTVTIQGNRVSNSLVNGIEINTASNVTIGGSRNDDTKMNLIEGSLHYGLAITKSDGTEVLGNRILNNTESGLYLHEVQNATIGNISADNALHIEGSSFGITAWGDLTGTMVVGNTIENNRDAGVCMVEAKSFTLFRNTIINNGPYGVLAFDDSSGTSIQGNYIEQSDAGVWLSGTSGITIGFDGNDFTGEPGVANKITDNYSVGIIVQGSTAADNAILSNEIYLNTYHGIHFASGSEPPFQLPRLTSASISGDVTAITGTLSGTNGEVYRIQYFKNSPEHIVPGQAPQGRELVAEREVTIGTSGVVDVNIDIDSNKISAGDWITATTTRIISGTPTHTHRFSLGIQAN